MPRTATKTPTKKSGRKPLKSVKTQSKATSKSGRPTKASQNPIDNHTCLCGCGAPVQSLFLQGHDAKLKSAILHGRKISPDAMRYASQHWPAVVDRSASRSSRRG